MNQHRIHRLSLFLSFLSVPFLLQGCASPSVDRNQLGAISVQGSSPAPDASRRQDAKNGATGSPAVPMLSTPAVPAVVGSGGRSSLISAKNDLARRRSSLAAKVAGMQKILSRPVEENSASADEARLKTCLASAVGIVSAYDGLIAEMDRVPAPLQISGDTLARLHGLFMQDLSLHDGDCLFLLSPVSLAQKSDPWTKEAGSVDSLLIDKLFNDGKMQEITTYFDRLAAHKREQLHPGRIRKVAFAMSRTGRFQDAATLFLNLSQEEGASVSLPHYIEKAADLFYAAGDLAKAHALYEKLTATDAKTELRRQWAAGQISMLAASGLQSPDMEAFRELLQDYVRMDGLTDKKAILEKCEALQKRFANSNGAQGAAKIRDAVFLREKDWFYETLLQINLREKEGDPAGALVLVIRMEQADLSWDLGRQLAAKKQELQKKLGSPVTLPKALGQEELLKKQDEGLRLLQANQYDKAIESLNFLLGSEYEQKARELIQRASREAAEEQRKKAADFYVKATRAREQGKKLELCMESRRLLRDILARYPQANLNTKVSKHLDVVDRCIQAAGGDSVDAKNIKASAASRDANPAAGVAAVRKAQPAAK